MATITAEATHARIPYRRVVPSGYHMALLRLVGTSPLLMNSGEGDRDSEQYRAFYQLGQKSKKSLDDEARLRELAWSLSLYHDEELGPFIPGKNVKEMLRSSATKWRRGEDVKRSLVVVQNRIPLEYAGPREPQELWDEGFRYTALVANAGFNRGRVTRCRPCFDEWEIEAELAFDPEDIDFDFLELVVERSQKFGLGDYRPEFGSFAATLVKDVEKKSSAKTNGSKPEDKRAKKAHRASVERVMQT